MEIFLFQTSAGFHISMDGNFVIDNSRRRSIKCADLNRKCIETEKDFECVCSPCLGTTMKSDGFQITECYFLPLCLMKIALQSFVYTRVDKSLSIFISQYAVLLVQRNLDIFGQVEVASSLFKVTS